MEAAEVLNASPRCVFKEICRAANVQKGRAGPGIRVSLLAVLEILDCTSIRINKF